MTVTLVVPYGESGLCPIAMPARPIDAALTLKPTEPVIAEEFICAVAVSVPAPAAEADAGASNTEATPFASVNAVAAAGVIAANVAGFAVKVTTVLLIGFLAASTTVAEALTELPSESVLVVDPETVSVSFNVNAGVVTPGVVGLELLPPPPPPPPQPPTSKTAEANATPKAFLRLKIFIVEFPIRLSK